MTTELKSTHEDLCREWESEIYRTKHNKIHCTFDHLINQFVWSWEEFDSKGSAPLPMLEGALDKIRKEMSFEQVEERNSLASLLQSELHSLTLSQLKRVKKITEEDQP